MPVSAPEQQEQRNTKSTVSTTFERQQKTTQYNRFLNQCNGHAGRITRYNSIIETKCAQKKGLLNAQECLVAFRAAINAIPELPTAKGPTLLSHNQPSTTPQPYQRQHVSNTPNQHVTLGIEYFDNNHVLDSYLNATKNITEGPLS